MAEIVITQVEADLYGVELTEGGRTYTYMVMASPVSLVELGRSPDEAEAVIRESFAFLLEREPASAILREFSLEDITRYFPGYPDAISGPQEV